MVQPNIQYRRNPFFHNLPNHDVLGVAEAPQIIRFHRTWPQYRATPLRHLPELAQYVDVAAICVKDESQRFGIRSFKVLGSSWAMGRYLALKWGLPSEQITFAQLQDRAREHQPLTFAAASDGNHGLGVAWTARELGQRAMIYLPAGTVGSRVDRIRSTGAMAEVTPWNYDDTVEYVGKLCQHNDWVMIQDTAWQGYHDIPLWVMQGYMTMVMEAQRQWNQIQNAPPTHIILQAGVGSLAGAVTGWFAHSKSTPAIIIAEPTAAPALWRSAASPHGQPVKVAIDHTIMAGLACGQPNPTAWEIIRQSASGFLICDDVVAARGTRILANPLPPDPVILAGESGSMPLGLLVTLLDHPEYKDLRDELQLDDTSRILLFNTEGITDPALFRELVWDAKYPLTAKGH
ncbi:MAG: diaminopropionate ammonia-lyase [Sulfobacillus sp.]